MFFNSKAAICIATEIKFNYETIGEGKITQGKESECCRYRETWEDRSGRIQGGTHNTNGHLRSHMETSNAETIYIYT